MRAEEDSKRVYLVRLRCWWNDYSWSTEPPGPPTPLRTKGLIAGLIKGNLAG